MNHLQNRMDWLGNIEKLVNFTMGIFIGIFIGFTIAYLMM